MLVLAILLTAAVLARQCTGINLTYIVKTEDGELQPSCIAEENERYAGIGWVYPLAAAPRIATKFVPTIRNDYNCKFDGRDKCAKSWALKNWQIDANSTRTLDLLFDSRWEDLPAVMTANGTKEFADRVEVPSVFRAGLSLRAAESAELLVCDGWNPYNYPCYHLNMSRTEIFLRKYTTLRKNISSSDRFLDSYKVKHVYFYFFQNNTGSRRLRTSCPTTSGATSSSASTTKASSAWSTSALTEPSSNTKIKNR
jgi:hypothetical protein